MALTVIYPQSASVYTRVIDSTGLSELHLDYGPNLVLVLTGSFPVTSSAIFFQGFDTGSLYPLSCSWAINVVSASATTSASWALSSSYAANAGGTSMLNATVPTWKIYVTASIPTQTITSMDVVALAYITTSNARPDGADFRVQRADPVTGNASGSYLPCCVAVSPFNTGSTMGYQVWWTDTYVSNSINKYLISYGDPNGNYMYLNQSQMALIKKRGLFMNGYAVYQDNSQADWYPITAWGTIGVRIPAFTGADEAAAAFPTATPYSYNGQTYNSFSYNANNIMRYGTNVIGGNNIASPDVWGVNYADNRTNFVDMCSAVDGWVLQVDSMRPYSSPSQNFKHTVRYRNNGKFIITVFDTSPVYQSTYGNNVYINGYTGTTLWSYGTSTLVTASNPASAMAVVMEPLAASALSGSEMAY